MKRALALLFVLLVACRSTNPSPPSPTAGGATVEPSPSTAAGSAGFEAAGPPKDLGTGIVTGISRDGTVAYTNAERPESGRTACEGLPAQYLFAVPLDGTPRRLAAPDNVQPVDGALRRSPDGSRVFVAEYCEEFFVRLRMAIEEPGGTLAAVSDLNVATNRYQFFNALQWAPDSKSILGVGVDTSTATPRRDIVRIDAASGAVTPIEADVKAIAVAELPGGAIASISSERTLKVGAKEIAFQGPFGLSPSPDYTKVAVYGEGGVIAISGSGESQRVTSDLATGAAWSSDGASILYTDRSGVLRLTVIGGATKQIAEGARYGPGYFTPDDRKLVYTYEPVPPETPSPPLVRVIASK
jgi:hypothetical protein